MGCANAKETAADNGSIQETDSRLGTGTAGKFIEMLFQSTGQIKKLRDGDELIKQGAETESAFYIKDGKVTLLLTDDAGNITKLATRGPGDVLGELSLLLGHEASVSAIAVGPVTIIEVQSSVLLTMLREEPGQSGQLFKVRPAATTSVLGQTGVHGTAPLRTTPTHDKWLWHGTIHTSR